MSLVYLILYTLDSERSNACIDFTIMCVFLFLCLKILKALFLAEKILQSLTLREVSSDKLNIVYTY